MAAKYFEFVNLLGFKIFKMPYFIAKQSFWKLRTMIIVINSLSALIKMVTFFQFQVSCKVELHSNC